MKNNSRQKIPFMEDVFPAVVKREYIDVSMTEKIKKHIRQRTSDFLEIEEESNENFLAFEELRFLYEELLSCDDTLGPYFCYGNALVDDKTEVSKILSDLRIKVTSCMAFSLRDKHSINVHNETRHKKYYIVVFSNTVLLFIDPCNKPVTFLCALKTTAFQVSFQTKTIERTVTVHETSREPVAYYKKFNPVPDSKILSLNWETTNRDGSRSFRGGLKPENNPLHFSLEYGAVTLRICSADIEYGFSNSGLAKTFAEAYSKYFERQITGSADGGAKQGEFYDMAQNAVKKLCRTSLWGKYKSLSPVMQCFLFFLLVPCALACIGLIVFLISMIITLFT